MLLLLFDAATAGDQLVEQVHQPLFRISVTRWLEGLEKTLRIAFGIVGAKPGAVAK